MTTVNGLMPIDSNAASVSNSASSSSTSFSGVMDGLSLVSGSLGPATATILDSTVGTGAATIASATSSSIYSSSTALAGGNPYTMGMTSGGTYYGGASPMGLTSGAGYSTTGTTGTTGDVSTDVESILASTATSQSYLIGLQAMMGQQQSTFTAISNALNVKYSMERSAIQNFRS